MIILVRVQMRLSFHDKESYKETVESLGFNSSDPNAHQRMGSNSMPFEDDSERNEDNITPITLRRVGSSNSLSIQETRRSGDIL